jgi:hypothetical protein
MANLSFRQSGLVLQRGGAGATKQQIRELQRSLRALGYLKSGIDGVFGPDTEDAVKGLQWDLLHNDGASTGGDGSAPIGVRTYNRSRVAAVTGGVDQPLVECISDMLDDSRNAPTLPLASNPAAENQKIAAQVAAMPTREVPIPFLVAILRQESGLRHYNEPAAGDDDTYIVVGLDRNDDAHPERITSRGYGVGQYTLFHQPPRPQEITDIMSDTAKNLQQAVHELRNKFDHFVNGPDSNTRADDRITEFGHGPLRLCKYGAEDPRFMRDCKQCAVAAGLQDIKAGVTQWYEGAGETYQPTKYYAEASYRDVPIRKNIGCDWPYAARRYNGSGMNSYHYQVRILKNLLHGDPPRS